MSRQGPGGRPDFRSRAQNTSRPPSIHVDDFNDMYGDSSAASGARSYSSLAPAATAGSSKSQSRSSYSEFSTVNSQQMATGGVHGDHHHHHYFSPPPPGPYNRNSRNPGSSSSSSSYSSRAKYMKMK